MTKKKIDLKEKFDKGEHIDSMQYEVGTIKRCTCGGTKFTIAEVDYQGYDDMNDELYEEQICNNCASTVAMQLVDYS